MSIRQLALVFLACGFVVGAASVALAAQDAPGADWGRWAQASPGGAVAAGSGVPVPAVQVPGPVVPPAMMKAPIDAVPPIVTNFQLLMLREAALIKKIEVKPDPSFPSFLGPPAPGENRPRNPSR
jgi:hypothetical protein